MPKILYGIENFSSGAANPPELDIGSLFLLLPLSTSKMVIPHPISLQIPLCLFLLLALDQMLRMLLMKPSGSLSCVMTGST